jgi:hypothetical protein
VIEPIGQPRGVCDGQKVLKLFLDPQFADKQMDELPSSFSTDRPKGNTAPGQHFGRKAIEGAYPDR